MNNINVFFLYLLIHQQEQQSLYVIWIILMKFFIIIIILSQGPIRSTIKQAKLSSAKRLCEHLLQAG